MGRNYGALITTEDAYQDQDSRMPRVSMKGGIYDYSDVAYSRPRTGLNNEATFVPGSTGGTLASVGYSGLGQTEPIPVPATTLPTMAEITALVKKNWVAILLGGLIAYRFWPKN